MSNAAKFIYVAIVEFRCSESQTRPGRAKVIVDFGVLLHRKSRKLCCQVLALSRA